MGGQELIFIMGATGFIGSHVVNYTLQAGYLVRLGILPNEEEAKIRRWIQGPAENVEFVQIPDITAPGAFSNVLNGVDFIFHLASPLPETGRDDFKKDYLEPAMTGTTQILEEALNYERVKLVVVMSSMATLVPLGDMIQPPVKLQANRQMKIHIDVDREWPEGILGLCKQMPHFKVITFHPVYTIGDSLLQQRSDEICGMNALLWQSLNSEERMLLGVFVHVRDVAEAHVAAVKRYESLASGTEYVLSQQPFSWERITKLVEAEYPQVEVRSQNEPFWLDDFHVDTTSTGRDLQVAWRSSEDAIRDVVNQQLALKEQAGS